jgi:mannose-6-phosphate isomerase-like protein (cupin superfamily)
MPGPHIRKSTTIPSAGNKPKIIREFIGRVNTESTDISIARMKSPAGWEEPAQTPEFDEYTFVLKGSVEVKTEGRTYTINQNEVFLAQRGKTVQYKTPAPGGAEYIAICLPAFSPDTVHREDE